MQILLWILFLISLFSLFDTVAAVPPFNQHGIIRVVETGATLGLMTYLSLKFFNPLLSANKKQEPEIPKVEIQEDVSTSIPTSISLLPTPTFESANETTLEEALPSSAEEPCILNSIFAFDPSDVIIPFPGAPHMVKLTNLTAACNGTVIEMYEFVTVLVEDIPKFFQNSNLVDEDEKFDVPPTVESVYPSISLGVNIPEPDSAALSKPSTSWHLAEVFQNAYQDKRSRPFIEAARRKFCIVRSLLGKILSPILLLLPRGSSPMPMILISIPLIRGIWSRTRRRRRQFVSRYAPVLVGWEPLQSLARILGKGSGTVGSVTDKALEDGPHVQQSVAFPLFEVQAAVETMRTLISIIERQPVTSEHQDKDQGGDDGHGGDGSFADSFEFPFQLQHGVPSHINAVDLLPAKNYEGGHLRGNPKQVEGFLFKPMRISRVNVDVAKIPASSDPEAEDVPLSESPVKSDNLEGFRSRSPSPSKPESEGSPSPPKLPHFTRTRSTQPIAEKARFLPFMSSQKDGRSRNEFGDMERMPTDEHGHVRIRRVLRPSLLKMKKIFRPVPVHQSEDEDEPTWLGSKTPAKKLTDSSVDDKHAKNALNSAPSSDERTASEDNGQVVERISPINSVENPADIVATEADSEDSDMLSPVKEQSEDVISENTILPSSELEHQGGAGVPEDSEAISPIKEQSQDIPSKDVVPPSSEPEKQEGTCVSGDCGTISPFIKESEDVPSDDIIPPSSEQDGAGTDADIELVQSVDSIYGPRFWLQNPFDNIFAQQPVEEVRRPSPLIILEDSLQGPGQLQIKEPVNFSSPLNEDPMKPSISGGIPGLDDEEELPDSPLMGKGKSRARDNRSREAQPDSASNPFSEEDLRLAELEFTLEWERQDSEDNEIHPPSSKADATGPVDTDDHNNQMLLSAAYFPEESGPDDESNEASSSKQLSTDLLTTDPESAASSNQSSAPEESSTNSSSLLQEQPIGEVDEQPLTNDSSDAASAELDRSDPVWQDTVVNYLLGIIRAKFTIENVNRGMLRCYLDNWSWDKLTEDDTEAVCKQFLEAATEWEAQQAAKATGESSTEVETELISHVPIPPPVAHEVFPTSNGIAQGDDSQEDVEKKALSSSVGAERRAVRFATNLDGSVAVDTHRFSIRDAPAAIQEGFSMEVDAEGLEATGAQAPTPLAFVQPSTVVAEAPNQQEEMEVIPCEAPDQREEMEGVELEVTQDAMDGVAEHAETVVSQSEAHPQELTQHISPNNRFTSTVVAQDRELTMFEGPVQHVSLNNEATFNLAQALTMFEAPAQDISMSTGVTADVTEANDKDLTMSEVPVQHKSPYNVVPPAPVTAHQGGYVSKYNVIPPPLVPPRQNLFIRQETSIFEDFLTDSEMLEALANEMPELQTEVAQPGSLTAFDIARIKAAEGEKAAGEEKPNRQYDSLEEQRLWDAFDSEYGQVNLADVPEQRVGDGRKNLVPRLSRKLPRITDSLVASVQAKLEEQQVGKGQHPISSHNTPGSGCHVPENPLLATANPESTLSIDDQQDVVEDSGNVEEDSASTANRDSALSREDQPDTGDYSENVDEDSATDISSLNEEERSQLPLSYHREFGESLFWAAARRKAEQESQQGEIEVPERGVEDSSTSSVKKGCKRGWDEDEDGDEDQDEKDKEESASAKRQLPASQVFHCARPDRQLPGGTAPSEGAPPKKQQSFAEKGILPWQEDGIGGYERESSGPNGGDVYEHSVEDFRRQVVYCVADEEDWPDPAELSNEENEDSGDDDRDEDEDEEGDNDDDDDEKELPSLTRLFHTLNRLSRTVPCPSEITEPRWMMANCHRSYDFESVAVSPWWCDSPVGRAWMTTNWATFRYEHGWRLIHDCNEIVDEYLEWQEQQAAIQEDRDNRGY